MDPEDLLDDDLLDLTDPDDLLEDDLLDLTPLLVLEELRLFVALLFLELERLEIVELLDLLVDLEVALPLELPSVPLPTFRLVVFLPIVDVLPNAPLLKFVR